MTDLSYIRDLLSILKEHSVSHIKMQGLELTFHGEQLDVAQPQSSVEAIAETLKKQEEAMPPDLRADSLMDQDKILNWSSPDQAHDEPELPLTGEQPL